MKPRQVTTTMRPPVGFLIIVVAAGIIGGAANRSPAQQCMRIESVPERSSLTVRGQIGVSGVAPATFCQLEPGRKYLLTASRLNFERRSLRFSFAEFGATPSFGGVRAGTVARSVVLPGWGQYTMGQGGRAAQTFTFLAAAGFKVWQAYSDYSDAKDKHEYYANLAEESSQQAVVEKNGAIAVKAAKDANELRIHTLMTAGLAGWIYAGNLLESFLLASPPKAVSTDGTYGFTVEIPRRSRARAGFRSFFVPGLGQQYNGSPEKGFLYQSTFLVLAFYALDAKMRYDLARVDYQLAYSRYESAESVAEMEAARVEAREKFLAKDSRRETMYALAASAGAVWLINVVDAVASGSAEKSSDRFELGTSYESETLRTGLRVSF